MFQENRLKSKDQIGKGTRRRKLDLFGLISSPWPPPSREKSNPCLKINSQSKKKNNDTYNHHHHHYHLTKNGIWCALDQFPKTQKQPHFMRTSTTTHTITTHCSHHRFFLPTHHDHPFPQIIVFLLPCILSSGSKESKTKIFSTGESIILNVYPIWRRSGENTL